MNIRLRVVHNASVQMRLKRRRLPLFWMFSSDRSLYLLGSHFATDRLYIAPDRFGHRSHLEILKLPRRVDAGLTILPFRNRTAVRLFFQIRRFARRLAKSVGKIHVALPDFNVALWLQAAVRTSFCPDIYHLPLADNQAIRLHRILLLLT